MASVWRSTWNYFKNDWLTRHSKVTTTYDGIWLQTQSHGRITLGLTDEAKADIGEITFIEYPTKGTQLKAGDPLIDIEGGKAVETFKAPVNGTIVEYNDDLRTNPAQIAQNKFAKNWIVKLKTD